MFILYASIPLCLVAVNSVTAQYLPNSEAFTVSEIEHLYLDAATHGFFSAITPCTNYLDPTANAPNNNLGMQTAAEWIRTAFHDFVTADIYTETGGLDASIGFETGRAENVGPAFNDALLFFSFFFNSKVSMSDLIALGVVTATANCGGPIIPMKTGRIDATAAGPSGVPEPETDIQTTLDDFSNAGFNSDDTITLTACGHTMGGVHRNSFPQVVTSASAVTSTNQDGRIPFDETVGVFDIGTVNDYVHATGDQGGPLVTTSNVTVRSDLRLYEFDQNSTITRLSQSSSYFESQCQGVFQRMIETIPCCTQLNSDMSPTTSTNLKPVSLYLSVDWKGNMKLTGFMRYVQVSGAAAPPTTYTITLIGRNGQTTGTTATATQSSTDTGTGVFGPTRQYPFSLSFLATTGLGGISVGGQTFQLQDTMFIVPSLSNFSPTPPQFSTTSALNTVSSYTINITAAYLTTSPPATLTATFNIPVPQAGTVSPTISTATTSTLNKIGTSGPFTLYSALTTQSLSAKQVYGTSVDVAAPGQSAGAMFWKPFNPAA